MTTTAKSFFEKYPLYRKINADILLKDDEEHMKAIALSNMMSTGGGFRREESVRKFILEPSLNFICSNCKTIQTFNIVSKYEDDGFNFIGRIFRADYICSSCRSDLKTYFIRFSKEKTKDKKEEKVYVQKIGQFPSWSIDPEKNIQNLLGRHEDLIKKGLICESQGFGIGSYSYFRRITEEIIDELLDSISEILNTEQRVSYLEALEQVKKTQITKEKINLVKDLLPASLRPGGNNPLDLLYSVLSGGLHEESDEVCLEFAEAIRTTLEYLITQIIKEKEASKELTESMEKLLKMKKNKV